MGFVFLCPLRVLCIRRGFCILKVLKPFLCDDSTQAHQVNPLLRSSDSTFLGVSRKGNVHCKVSPVLTRDRCQVDRCVYLQLNVTESYLRTVTDDETRLQKFSCSLPKMDVHCSPTITTYPSHPLYDESFWLKHKPV